MNNTFIWKMVDNLISTGLLAPEKKEEALKELTEVYKETVCLEWCVDDVLHQAEESGCKIDREEAREMLDMVERNHDCGYGVSWTPIDHYVRDLWEGVLEWKRIAQSTRNSKTW